MRRNWIVAALLLLAPLAWADKSDLNRGYLGVELQTTESIHKDGVPVQDDAGILLSNVMSGGPAELAGLRADDRVVAIDGREIGTMEDLKSAMMTTRKGDRVSVTVERDDSEQTFDVVLGKLPEKLVKVERYGVLVELVEDRAFVGIESQPVEDQLAEYFGVEGGILVTRVVEGTPAEQAGIRAGDVIVAWEGTPLRKQHDVHEMISRSKPGDEIELLISRRGIESRTFVVLDAAADHLEKQSYELREHPGELEFREEKRRFKIRVKETKSAGR